MCRDASESAPESNDGWPDPPEYTDEPLELMYDTPYVTPLDTIWVGVARWDGVCGWWVGVECMEPP